jgi:hypothetical protein
MAGEDAHPVIGASDIVLAEVTQEELDAEAEAAEIDMLLEFEELEAEGCAIEQGSQVARALTARDAAVAAATGRLKVQLHALRDEIARSGGVTARRVLASRLNFSAQAEATVCTLGVTASDPSAQEALQHALGASIEEAVWSWLHTSAQHESTAGCTKTLAGDATDEAHATDAAARQWTHGLAIASSSTTAAQTCSELMDELRSTAARNAACSQQLRARIADLRRVCGLKQQIVALESESRVLLQTLASLRQQCIDQQVNRASFGDAVVTAPGQGEAQQDVAQLKAEMAAADARLEVVRRELEDTGRAFARAVPLCESAGSGTAVVRESRTFTDTQAKAPKTIAVTVSTGTDCQVDIG